MPLMVVPMDYCTRELRADPLAKGCRETKPTHCAKSYNIPFCREPSWFWHCCPL